MWTIGYAHIAGEFPLLGLLVMTAARVPFASSQTHEQKHREEIVSSNTREFRVFMLRLN